MNDNINMDSTIAGNEGISFTHVGNSVFPGVEYSRTRLKDIDFHRSEKYSNHLFWPSGRTYFFSK